jgi:hypothetical protein
MGEIATGFKVEFTWLGAGAPGSQAFTVWDPTTLDVLFTGVSTAGGTTPIPEPATAALLPAGRMRAWLPVPLPSLACAFGTFSAFSPWRNSEAFVRPLSRCR